MKHYFDTTIAKAQQNLQLRERGSDKDESFSQFTNDPNDGHEHDVIQPNSHPKSRVITHHYGQETHQHHNGHESLDEYVGQHEIVSEEKHNNEKHMERGCQSSSQDTCEGSSENDNGKDQIEDTGPVDIDREANKKNEAGNNGKQEGSSRGASISLNESAKESEDVSITTNEAEQAFQQWWPKQNIGKQLQPLGQHRRVKQGYITMGSLLETEAKLQELHFGEIRMPEEYRRRKLLELRIRWWLDGVGSAHQPVAVRGTSCLLI